MQTAHAHHHRRRTAHPDAAVGVTDAVPPAPEALAPREASASHDDGAQILETRDRHQVRMLAVHLRVGGGLGATHSLLGT